MLVLSLLHVTTDNCLRDCALMSHGYQDRYLPYCKDSCVQALQKNSWCGEKIPPQVPAKCSEGSKAGRTCCFQDMRGMYREEKNGDIQTLQRTGVTNVCAGEKKKKKKVIKIPANFFVEHFKHCHAGWGYHICQKGQQVRNLFKAYAFIFYTGQKEKKKASSIQEIPPCVRHSTL